MNLSLNFVAGVALGLGLGTMALTVFVYLARWLGQLGAQVDVKEALREVEEWE